MRVRHRTPARFSLSGCRRIEGDGRDTEGNGAMVRVEDAGKTSQRDSATRRYLRRDMGNEQRRLQVDRGRPACWSAEHWGSVILKALFSGGIRAEGGRKIFDAMLKVAVR